MLNLTYNYIQTKAKALAGNLEYINAKIFNVVDYDWNITSSRKSIMCYNLDIKDTSILL